MPEKFSPRESGVNRVVGVSSEEENGVLDVFAKMFNEESVGEFEAEKSPEVLKLIEDLNINLRVFLKPPCRLINWFCF
ncbi:MAG: hypothetical protein UX09_C0016G0001 [Candidatus Uhrbacteria bacterium GW2011_GWE2_45_35]|uniref:Uncharacterized protein n=2 Tax=Candidatus Uhriibacteriota TaxID=1752732 RepID=A0A0G1JJH2_9BACT|nr:MAG: hypothetical protein UW63_C0009G0020 [Candidatus Uhrbacteria bacterium GW2011_GWF2_44_350]KKU08537.1 MAG: hypothetical protein UX09_C0016G0001 [Candidatus Uhrbacteria bacterium GW2011_GWE2_45_35]HBR80042.1 hypothetical protein [Candidatus Uhrbacteria bacterium]HCU31139.1 hypothetical protein [Candidatus Uhrbacteria bacterium]